MVLMHDIIGINPQGIVIDAIDYSRMIRNRNGIDLRRVIVENGRFFEEHLAGINWISKAKENVFQSNRCAIRWVKVVICPFPPVVSGERICIRT